MKKARGVLLATEQVKQSQILAHLDIVALRNGAELEGVGLEQSFGRDLALVQLAGVVDTQHNLVDEALLNSRQQGLDPGQRWV